MADPTEPVPEHLRQLVDAVNAAVPPAITEVARWAAGIRATFAPSIDAIRSAQQAIALALPDPGGLVELLENVQRASRWAQEAPKALQVALAGRTVVHQELSLSDLGVIIRAFQEGGEDAAVAKVGELHEDILAGSAFRDRFRARWATTGRLPIMNDVVAAYDAGLYFAAIPPALAQCEGIVAEFFALTDMRFPELKRRVQELHGDDDLFAPLVMEFLEGLLVRFDHGRPVPQLNRHAVQHGADKAYGTKPNAVAAIIWADYLLGVTIEAREKRANEAPSRVDDG